MTAKGGAQPGGRAAPGPASRAARAPPSTRGLAGARGPNRGFSQRRGSASGGELVTAAIVPVLGLGALGAAAGGVPVLVGMLVAVSVGLGVYRLVDDAAVAFAAAGLAPVLAVSAWAGAGSVLAVVVFVLALVLGGPVVGLALLPTGLWAHPVGAFAACLGVALALLGPVGRWRGLSRGRHWIAAGVSLVAIVGPATNAGPLLTWGALWVFGRLRSHPRRDLLAPRLRDLGFVAAAAPAIALVGLAALGRTDLLGPISLLATGWAVVAVGLIGMAAAAGFEVFIRDDAPGPLLVLGVTAAGAGAAAWLMVAGETRQAGLVVGAMWPAVGLLACVGVRRVVAPWPAARPLAWVALGLAAAASTLVGLVL